MHPVEKIGVATAGLASLQCLFQGIAGKLILVAATAGSNCGLPWLPFAVVAGTGLIALLIGATLPLVAGGKHD